MEKQVIYFEATYQNKKEEDILDSFKCRDTQDYKTHLRDLHRHYTNIKVLYREWDNGDIEDGDLTEEVDNAE